ncbi:MAG: hypothetical protein V8S24_07130 [Gordonibacter pamelaeae]
MKKKDRKRLKKLMFEAIDAAPLHNCNGLNGAHARHCQNGPHSQEALAIALRHGIGT